MENKIENKTKDEVKKYSNVLDLIIDLASYEIVINVTSESEAEEFIRVMEDNYNMTWANRSDCHPTCYYYNQEDTCYNFKYGRNFMTYSDVEFFKFEEGKDVIPYSEVRDLLVNGSIYNNNLCSNIKTKSEKENDKNGK